MTAANGRALSTRSPSPVRAMPRVPAQSPDAPVLKRSRLLSAVFGDYTSMPHVPTVMSLYGIKAWFRTSRLPEGTIEFNTILYLFTPGMEVIDLGLPGEDVAFVVTSAAFPQRDGASVCVIEGYNYDWRVRAR